MLADPIVRLLLGPNWLAAIPLIQIFGLYGAISVFQATNASIFNVLGVPKYGAVLKAVEVLLVLPPMVWALTHGFGLQGAAWCVFAAQGVIVPCSMVLLSRQLGIGWADRARVTWRPLLGTAALGVSLYEATRIMGAAENAFEAAWQLALLIPVAAAVFLGCVSLFWRLAGKPPGAEQQLVDLLRRRFGRPGAVAADASVPTATPKP